MPRGNAIQTKCHFKGDNDDFIIFVESSDIVKNWRKDRSIPLADVVSGFKIFVSHKQGNQGVLDTASNGMLDSEFGTHNEDKVITAILEKGEVQDAEEKGRSGDRNITQGPTISHYP